MTEEVRRRTFIAAGLVVLSTPAVAVPQPASRVYRIGSLTRGGREAAAPYNRALEEGLAR